MAVQHTLTLLLLLRLLRHVVGELQVDLTMAPIALMADCFCTRHAQHALQVVLGAYASTCVCVWSRMGAQHVAQMARTWWENCKWT